MRAVVVARVVEGGVVVAEIPAVDVVDVAVGVVVDPVAGGLAGVHPGPARQVGMREVDPVVDDRDHHVGTAGRDLPGLGDVHVDVLDPGEAPYRLPRVVQGPLLSEQRLAGGAGEHMAPILTLDRCDLGPMFERGGGGGQRTQSPRRLDELGIREGDIGHKLQALGCADGPTLVGRGTGPIRDEQPAGWIAWRGLPLALWHPASGGHRRGSGEIRLGGRRWGGPAAGGDQQAGQQQADGGRARAR